MKIYISQPYAYKSDEEIVKVRNDIIKELHAYMKDIEILDSVIQKEQTFGLKQLSESILVLSDADAIIFAPGWEESRGCRIEHLNYVFKECSSLKSLDLSNFDTSLVNTMKGMFLTCSSFFLQQKKIAKAMEKSCQNAMLIDIQF